MPFGPCDAVAFAGVSIARDIVRERTRLGLTQAELARRAGLRPETLNRIEKGSVTAATASFAKIDKALTAAAGTQRRTKSNPSRPTRP